MPTTVLAKAIKLFRKRKFADVIKLLEPQVFQHRKSFQYYYILGVACLYINDLNGAQSYLKRAGQLNDEDVKSLLGLAAVHFKRQEYEQSLKIWLHIVDVDPRNRIARRGLNLLRNNSRLERIIQNPTASQKIFPPVPLRIPVLPILTILVLASVSVFAAPLAIRKIYHVRPELAAIQAPEAGVELVTSHGNFRYTFSPQQIKAIYEKAKDLFNRYKDNLSIVECNRLIHSNASEAIKNVAKSLKMYSKKPDFSNFTNSFTLAQVAEDPFLYQDSFVRWSGKLANLRVDTEKIDFDFLVGYHLEQELEGIIPVTIDFAADLKNGNNIEILAQVEFTLDKLSLKGLSIHKLK